ncbi:peptidoglycan DD-metalloendopeptidase family protein [uncultured Sphingomonas sp.]|uniref:M23 family metallopeptidase n=1 Tax=uncultured Sphingomonas sp. TaxID=158754 RepID=UPI0035CAAB5A
MFLRSDQFEQSGGAAALSFGRAIMPVAELSPLDKLRAAIARVDWTPDLGARIGSTDWFRGLATCTALLTATWALSPSLSEPIFGIGPAPLTGLAWDEARALTIAPRALGADTGKRMAANDLVRPLKEVPERPILELTATFAEGDQLTGLLNRAGVSKGDAAAAAQLVSQAIALGTIRPGTRLDLTLGRRASKAVPRPLERLSFRASFDLNLTLTRVGQGLNMVRQAIAIDNTPLRIQGLVGSSLYRSARAAGVPAKVAESYIKALATRLSIGGDVRASDQFDFIIKQRRAATGEVELGELLFVGLDQGRRKVQLVRWAGEDGDAQWYDANGQSERRGFTGMPVAGRISSGFGMRFHPILHYFRMHSGLDIACPYGSPVYAVIDGTVTYARMRAGYGNFISVTGPGGGIGSGYAHLSRIVVNVGMRVSRGMLIGYSGNSGLSTGPHLHWEMYRNGVPVNPRGFSFASLATLSGSALKAFKAQVAALLAVRPGTVR